MFDTVSATKNLPSNRTGQIAAQRAEIAVLSNHASLTNVSNSGRSSGSSGRKTSTGTETGTGTRSRCRSRGRRSIRGRTEAAEAVAVVVGGAAGPVFVLVAVVELRQD